MSQPATSRGKTQTGSYVDDLESSELFEPCSALDSLETESNDSDHRLGTHKTTPRIALASFHPTPLTLLSSCATGEKLIKGNSKVKQ